MPRSNRTRARGMLFGISAVCLLVMLIWGAGPAAALPPRPSPSPIPESVPAIPGGLIKLTTQSFPADVWTVVQWQDARGDWHDVEGWRGSLDELAWSAGKKTWWVARPDYAKGPFRWVVYARQGGAQLAVSDKFNLPTRDDAAVLVTLSPQ